jgi:TorA maturation chaperone TorD
LDGSHKGSRGPSEGQLQSQDPKTPQSSLSPFQLALARGRTYDLLGRLALDGLTAEQLPYVEAIPELAATLPARFEADEAAADHQQLFGFNVYPHESIFLDPAGLLGGPVAETVLFDRRQAGFAKKIDSDMVDHLGQELRYLAVLCDLEANARDNNLNDVTQRMSDLQQEFLDRHLLRWLPALLLSIEKQELAFYTALIQLVLDVSLAHRTELPSGPAAAFVLPDPPELLTQKGTGLKEIAAYLLAPPYSGIYLSRDDIGRLAREQELPRGFGNRQQMLLNMWQSAATYDGLEANLGTLQTFVSSWFDAYSHMAENAHLQPFVVPWKTRAAGTISLLAEMRANLPSLD